MSKHRRPVFLLVAATFVLTGCNATAPRRDPAYLASYPAAYGPPAQPQTGAIYQAGYDMLLYEDIKARRIGDILTIILSESTTASKSASTDIERETTTAIENPTVLGANPQFDLPSILPLDRTDDNTLESRLSGSTEFAGESDSDQRNRLTGNISVTVTDVLPNGNLMVRGEKRLNLNQGNEYIKISGIVRPTDIESDNTVLSTKVADATIIYNGDGAIADSNRIGWLGRFFISAVFPF
jgi:flagellar L-ring protein precursor FlgH